MTVQLVTLILSVSCFILLLLITIKIWTDKTDNHSKNISEQINSEFTINRSELNKSLSENRIELNNSINSFQQNFIKNIQELSEYQYKALNQLNKNINSNSKQDRDEITQSLQRFQTTLNENIASFNQLQKEKFDLMNSKQNELIKTTEIKLETMRVTVDEKLHKTLEERLGQSFKIVSDRLEAVQKGLGEMQHLANGVGDLKKVLSNVKTRGVLGEIQLGTILEQILAPEQYLSNVKTKNGSDNIVEFAIKLPHRDVNNKNILLPIDAKFPQEDYIRLQNAYENGDSTSVDICSKALVQSIKKFAKDIKTKYLDPPHTTDFGVMFLPTEGLYAEIAKQPDLITILQRDYNIIITGPTTLAAMLNSLQMGFRTLAIQKRSSEVWQVLGSVKKEFQTFGTVLDKAQKKINEANKELDTLVGTRTRMMLSKLKNIENDQDHKLDL